MRAAKRRKESSMLRRVLSVLAIATLVSVAPLAHAGFKAGFGVTVDQVNGYANGALGTARNSADSNEYLDCYATYGTGPAAYCAARDAAGYVVGCFTSDPNKVAALSSITSNSYISFSFDSSGTCTELAIENTSYYPPMAL